MLSKRLTTFQVRKLQHHLYLQFFSEKTVPVEDHCHSRSVNSSLKIEVNEDELFERFPLNILIQFALILLDLFISNVFLIQMDLLLLKLK
jgi:hypothetical protein